jgi:integrase
MPVARKKLALTDRSVKALRPPPEGGRHNVWDALMPGLCVRVSRGGVRSFYCAKRRAGDKKVSWVWLGVFPTMGLAEAREACREALTSLMAGEHPKAQAENRRLAEEEARSHTFAAIAEQFDRAYVSRLRSARNYRGCLTRHLVPALGELPLAEIRRRDVRTMLERVARTSGAATARQAYAVLRKTLSWALQLDITGFETNVAASISVSDIVGAGKARDRLLSDGELAAIWRAIPSIGEPAATIYRLLLLTGARRNEVAAATWADLDRDGRTLLVPAERSKNKQAQLIPASDTAVAYIDALPVFSGGRFMFGLPTAGASPFRSFGHAKARLDRALVEQGIVMQPFVLHDFRRSVRSGLGRLGIAPLVAELCLGHKQRGIAQVYDRYSYFSEKRAALEAWERHLLSVVNPPEPAPSNVVEFASIGARR